jgi:hypothetical protein
MPGLVYALNARSPGGPWYTVGYPGSEQANGLLLRLADLKRVRSAIVLTMEDHTAACRLLESRGVKFPGSYEFVDELVWPATRERLQMWRPR